MSARSQPLKPMTNKMLLISLATVGLSLLSRSASAQQLSLRLDDGIVTLHATNVTVDEILARWATTTGMTVVSQNGRGAVIPVTLHLSGVSEREALAHVLRDLSGYIMGQRRDPATGTVSIDRLVILPDSAPGLSDVLAAAPQRPPVPVLDDIDQAVPRELAPVVDAGDAAP